MKKLHSGVDSEEWRTKRYGRILGADVELLLASLRDVWREGQEVRESLIRPGAERFWERLAQGPSWAHLYQLPFEQVIALFAKMTGTLELIIESARSDCPSDAVMRDLPVALESQELPSDPLALPLILVLIANLDSISRYSLTINNLMERVRHHQCVESLSRAASVDTGVLALPQAQLFMRSLQIAGEYRELSDFLRSVGSGPHKGRAVYQELRWAEYILRDQGAFESCTHDEIHDLIVYRLRLYDDDRKLKDSKKSLFMVFQKWWREGGK